MKKHFLILSIITFVTNVFADDYPKTREERKAEEMGSVLGGEGIVFRPGKIASDSTKATSVAVNRYLWQASLETVNFAPLASADSNGGIIITDWYSPKNKPNYSFKINVYLKGDVISPDSIEVKVHQRVLRNGTWIQDDKQSDLSLTLEDKILRRARELYIATGR